MTLITIEYSRYKIVNRDKEALYNVTDNISSRAILRHNNIFNRYLPALFYLPSTTPLYVSVSKGAASTIFYTFVMVRPRDSNPRHPAPKVDTLPTELSRRSDMSLTRPFIFYSPLPQPSKYNELSENKTVNPPFLPFGGGVTRNTFFLSFSMYCQTLFRVLHLWKFYI